MSVVKPYYKTIKKKAIKNNVKIQSRLKQQETIKKGGQNMKIGIYWTIDISTFPNKNKKLKRLKTQEIEDT